MTTMRRRRWNRAYELSTELRGKTLWYNLQNDKNFNSSWLEAMILISKIEIDEKNHGLTVIDSYSSFDVTSTTSNGLLIEIPMRLEFKMRKLSIKRNCIFHNDVDNTTIGRHDFIDRRWAECRRLMFERMFITGLESRIKESSNCSISGSANGVWHKDTKRTRQIDTCSINVPTGNFGNRCNCRYTYNIINWKCVNYNFSTTYLPLINLNYKIKPISHDHFANIYI